MESARRSRSWTVSLIAIFVLSRVLYLLAGVRFDTGSLDFYWQFVDPALLRSDLWRSLWYLQEQMPGFNLFLGLGLRAFGSRYSLGFEVCFLLFGFTLALALFFLLLRMRIRPSIAFGMAALFTVNPATVLYENLLFYEYPIAMLFCLAALFWHRYLSSYRRFDAVVLFFCLMALGYVRVIYHLVWVIAMITLVAWMAREHWRRTLQCAAIPLLLLVIPYAKNIAMFRTFVPGSGFFSGINVISFAANGVSGEELIRLRDRGVISGAFLANDLPALEKIVPPPAATGIPMLDQRLKSTGAVNNLGLWKTAVGRVYRQDGVAILREHPSAILVSSGQNLKRYLKVADDGFPFDGRKNNVEHVAAAREIYHAMIVGYLISGVPIFMVIAIPILLLFGISVIIDAARTLIRAEHVSADQGMLVFCTLGILWLTAAVIFYDFTDQNRIMFEVTPLLVVLAAAFLERVLMKIMRNRTDLQRVRNR